MKRIIPIIILLLVVGCGSTKKKYEFKERIKHDSISFTREKIVYPALADTVYIDNPCDSITGKLKPFKQSYITPQGKIILETDNGKIKASVDLKEVVKEKEESVRISSDSKEEMTTEKKVSTNWNLIIWLVISIALNIFFIVRWIMEKLA